MIVTFLIVLRVFFLEYCNKGSVFVCGDFNSRTGLINDILPSDNLDRYIDVMWHDEVPNIPTRCSLDTIANRFGKLLIQLCYNTGLTICNGRLGNDRDGKFTFCSPNGRSLIDYMLASPNDYDKISNFGILNINEFSDHSPLVFEVGIKTVTEENLPKVSSFIKWEKDKVEEYKTKLNLHKNVMTEIVENLQQVGDANSAVKSLTDIIYNCAFEVFGSSRLTHEKEFNQTVKHNEWFNQRCKLEKAQFNSVPTLTQLSQNELKLVSALRRFIVAQEKQEEDVDKFLKQ
ncbi:Hypothetical predicted protein [Mytilus galloprovincialis]|uniref:Endonuclease/exonuclease/phosphatase domain-containing protein n=1 Tax=Mytilus galloprovincialis TaxID=29158 RepID=A0A8B6FPK4_MYTGA|nr:Hypothetical predicted protein [Mytilus galloprovincialis]